MPQAPPTQIVAQNSHANQSVQSNPLGDITNQVQSPQCLARKWKKLARKVGKTKKKEKADNGKWRMSIDPEEQSGSKK